MPFDRQAQIRGVHASRRAATDKRANDAIDALLKEKRPVNFNQVHELSGISVATLYKHEDIRRRIEGLRDRSRELPSHRDLKRNMTDESKDAIIASLKRKLKKLEDENRKLREMNKRSLAEQWEEL